MKNRKEELTQRKSGVAQRSQRKFFSTLTLTLTHPSPCALCPELCALSHHSSNPKYGLLVSHFPLVKSGNATGAFFSIEMPDSSTTALITAES